MQLPRRRAVTLAAALAAVAAVPAGAQAASPPAFDPAAFHFPGAGLAGDLRAGLPAVPLSFVAPSIGQIATVIGPTIITTSIGPGSGVSFVNTNNQVSAGTPVFGDQAAR